MVGAKTYKDIKQCLFLDLWLEFSIWNRKTVSTSIDIRIQSTFTENSDYSI